MTLRDVGALVRAPAALSVPGDSLAGAAAAGWPLGRRTFAAPLAGTLLYWGGMALNDWADREEDARERPDRPIPSGRIRAAHAALIGAGLVGCGLAVSALAGRSALAVAAPLAATVVGYDLALKRGPWGPIVMAAARGLDVCLGAGRGGLRPALPVAGTVAAHTLAVTAVSRAETEGSTAALPRAALGATVAIAAAAAFGPAPNRLARAGSATLAVTFAGVVGSAQWRAAADPRPATLQRAVAAGILGMIPLQASLAARSGAARVALPVALAWPLARRLSRKVSPT